MKGPLVVIVAFIYAVSSLPVAPDVDANLENSIVEASAEVLVDTLADESDVIYYFFNQNDSVVGTEIQSSQIGDLQDTEFSTLQDTVMLIHGWNENADSDFNIVLKSAFLTNHDVNVIVVDWGSLADANYVSARSAVNPVGQLVANVLQSLMYSYDLELSTVTLVGFSLGAHVAGAAGAALGGSVALIVGLDPAGPLFSVLDTTQRLDPSDAQFVQAIHTSSSYGYSMPLGDADYYPNGGSDQPGCGLNITLCPHERSYEYYAESVLASVNNFVAVQCSSYVMYGDGTCNGNAEESVMGGYPVDETASGNYYLNTNSASPYAEG